MKKKKNPNKQPVSYRSVDVKRITENAISTMTVVSWTCIIGGLLDFPEINSQTIIQLWDDVNLFSRRVGNESGRPLSEAKMREAEQKIGLQPITPFDSRNIRTEGDLQRFIRRTNDQTLRAGFILIIKPLINAGYSEEFLRTLTNKAYGIYDAVNRHEMEYHEINEALYDEQGLVLYCENNSIYLTQARQKE